VARQVAAEAAVLLKNDPSSRSRAPGQGDSGSGVCGGRCASAVLGLSLNDETPTNPPPALSISDALQSVSVTIIDYQSGKQCRLDVVLVDGVDSQDVELSGLVVVG
jgi:hypothetical protein